MIVSLSMTPVPATFGGATDRRCAMSGGVDGQTGAVSALRKSPCPAPPLVWKKRLSESSRGESRMDGIDGTSLSNGSKHHPDRRTATEGGLSLRRLQRYKIVRQNPANRDDRRAIVEWMSLLHCDTRFLVSIGVALTLINGLVLSLVL